ncbi:MAG: antitoxin [Candidatus Micrarchaeota archaeon]
MVFAQIELDDYTNHVLNVIKAKFALKDKSAAIGKMAELFGAEFVEREPREEYVKKILDIEADRLKCHPNRRMTIAELDRL